MALKPDANRTHTRARIHHYYRAKLRAELQTPQQASGTIPGRSTFQRRYVGAGRIWTATACAIVRSQLGEVAVWPQLLRWSGPGPAACPGAVAGGRDHSEQCWMRPEDFT